MVVDIGMIAYGRELDRRPVFGAGRRLRNTIARGGGPALLEIVYLIPGSLGRARDQRHIDRQAPR
jgi:hypothetical protein